MYLTHVQQSKQKYAHPNRKITLSRTGIRILIPGSRILNNHSLINPLISSKT